MTLYQLSSLSRDVSLSVHLSYQQISLYDIIYTERGDGLECGLEYELEYGLCEYELG